MHKWLFWGLLNLTGLGVCGSAMAADAYAVLPTNDSKGCSALIQQGDSFPPVSTNDLQSVQECLHLCDQLYKSLSDQGKTSDFLQGVSYCHKSLNNLYFASTAQVINDQLDQQTKQSEAIEQQDFLNKVSTMIKQKEEEHSADNSNPSTESPPASSAVTAPPVSAAAPAPLGPPDNVNW